MKIVVTIDLPALQTISLRYGALLGADNDTSCSLLMRSN